DGQHLDNAGQPRATAEAGRVDRRARGSPEVHSEGICDMSTPIARGHIEAFQEGFIRSAPQIKAVLPSHIPFEKFERVAMMAVQLEPRLLQCELRSLFLELQKCAADGLLPDRKEAVITYRWSSTKRCNLAV